MQVLGPGGSAMWRADHRTLGLEKEVCDLTVSPNTEYLSFPEEVP